MAEDSSIAKDAFESITSQAPSDSWFQCSTCGAVGPSSVFPRVYGGQARVCSCGGRARSFDRQTSSSGQRESHKSKTSESPEAIHIDNWFEGRDEVGRRQRLGVTTDGHYFLFGSGDAGPAEVFVEVARQWLRFNGYPPPPYVAERLFRAQAASIEKEARKRLQAQPKKSRSKGMLESCRRNVLEEWIQREARQTFGRTYGARDVEYEIQVWNRLVEQQRTISLLKSVGRAAAIHHWNNVASGRSRGWL